MGAKAQVSPLASKLAGRAAQNANVCVGLEDKWELFDSRTRTDIKRWVDGGPDRRDHPRLNCRATPETRSRSNGKELARHICALSRNLKNETLKCICRFCKRVFDSVLVSQKWDLNCGLKIHTYIHVLSCVAFAIKRCC